MKKIARLIIKGRIPIITGTLIITLGFLYFIKDVKINPDVTSYLPKNDSIANLYRYIGRQYGGNQLLLIALETGDVFRRETIMHVAELTGKFKEIDGISYVTSLTSVLDFKKIGDGLEVGRLIDEYRLPETQEDLHKLKQYTLSKEIYRNRLVSEDCSTTVIICRLAGDVDCIKITNQLKQIIHASGMSEKIYYGGYPVLINDMSKIITGDLKMLMPLVVLLIGLALYLSFRSVWCVILPILSMLISTIWTIGLMGLLKIPLTIISNILPVILVAVGSAYSIHVISKFREDDAADGDRYELAAASLCRVIAPVFLAAITTMAGFISFVFGAYLTMINEFGIFSSLGIFFAFVISVTFVPAMLVSLPRKRPLSKKDPEEKITASRIMGWVARFVVEHKILIVVTFTIILVISLVGMNRIIRQVDILDYFKPNTPTRLAEKEMQNRFGGSAPMYILVKGDIEDPSVLWEMRQLENFLKSIPNVHHPQSIVDILEEMNDLMGEGKTIPDRREKVSNLWFLIEGEDIMQHVVNEDKTEAVIQATLGKIDVHLTSQVINKIDDYINEHNSGSVKFTQTGMHFIHKKLDRAILFNQMQSLILALIFVFVVVAFLLRSFHGGLVGLVPISAALMLVFGVMGFCRIPLDLATMLVAGIAIGTGIDYAIHFTTRFRWEFSKETDPEKALTNVLNTTGKAILINVVTVALGFVILILANLLPLQRFGMLIALVTVGAGVGSITLLPAIMFIFKVGMNNQLNKQDDEGRNK